MDRPGSSVTTDEPDLTSDPAVDSTSDQPVIPPIKDDEVKDQDSSSNSGSGEEYQPSAMPSSSDDEPLNLMTKDGEEQPMRPPQPKKTSRKHKHSDEEEQSCSAMKRKKPGPARGNMDEKQIKRSWTDSEKRAVQRRMAKFFALRKVPGKDDCLRCIKQESAILCTRTWKDIKYLVYNEIIRIKRNLHK